MPVAELHYEKRALLSSGGGGHRAAWRLHGVGEGGREGEGNFPCDRDRKYELMKSWTYACSSYLCTESFRRNCTEVSLEQM